MPPPSSPPGDGNGGGGSSSSPPSPLLVLSLSASPSSQPHQYSSIITAANQKLVRASEQFEITQQAKLDIVAAQLANFFDVLCARLRDCVSQALRNNNNNKGNENNKSLSTTIGLSTSRMLFGKWQIASMVALMLSRVDTVPKLLKRLLSAFGVTGFVEYGYREVLYSAARRRQANLASAFLLGPTTKEDESVQTERAIRLVAQAISLRHIDQIVPLTKASQSLLAKVVAIRIAKHLKRHAISLENESRAPFEAFLQHTFVTLNMVYHVLLTPADKQPLLPTLSLVDRCVRALTAETCPDDDSTEVQFEPFFSSTSTMATRSWTVGNILNKPAVKVDECSFVHEFSDPVVYGYCYGNEREVRERGMWPMSKV